MTAAVWVAIGGCCGALARYGAGLLVQRTGAPHAAATLAVNVLGCFAIGFLSGVLEGRGDERAESLRKLAITGFLGSFTTFSAFGLDTERLWRDRGLGPAMVNVALNVLLGLAAVLAGRAVAKRLT